MAHRRRFEFGQEELGEDLFGEAAPAAGVTYDSVAKPCANREPAASPLEGEDIFFFPADRSDCEEEFAEGELDRLGTFAQGHEHPPCPTSRQLVDAQRTPRSVLAALPEELAHPEPSAPEQREVTLAGLRAPTGLGSKHVALAAGCAVLFAGALHLTSRAPTDPSPGALAEQPPVPTERARPDQRRRSETSPARQPGSPRAAARRSRPAPRVGVRRSARVSVRPDPLAPPKPERRAPVSSAFAPRASAVVAPAARAVPPADAQAQFGFER